MDKPILLVEDSPEDRVATIRAFSRVGVTNLIINCDDGDSALDYLYRRGVFSDPEKSPRPGLILLDLNLPGTDGRQVLEEVKQDVSLRRIPVIVFTTSSDPRDVNASYHAGANSYVQKPLHPNGLYEVVRTLKDYWYKAALLPVG